MRVMIVVTHLLGTGHLARSLILAKSFAQKGDEVTLVTGGTVVDHFEKAGVIIEQLMPVRSHGIEFQNLLTSDGLPVGADLLAGRREQLLITLAHFQPDILITELFPFGRRVLRDEFTAL
jgi:predicted glycosyltransferase